MKEVISLLNYYATMTGKHIESSGGVKRRNGKAILKPTHLTLRNSMFHKDASKWNMAGRNVESLN